MKLYERINNLPAGEWVDLNVACRLLNTKSRSYTKLMLLALPNILWRKVIVYNTPPGNRLRMWKWEFMRIEDNHEKS